MPLTQRIGTRFVAHRSGVLLRYLLRATFDAPDQGYANAQVLDTVAEGVQDGQLTVVDDANSSVDLVSKELVIISDGAGGWTNGGVYSLAIAKSMTGVVMNWKSVAYAGSRGLWGFHTAAALVEYPQFRIVTYSHNTLSIGDPVWGYNSKLQQLYADNTAYELALVLGGYDSNEAPWRAGQTKANYLYGAAYFIKGGTYATWTLLARVPHGNTTPLYFIVTGNDFRYEFSNIRIPDLDLSAVLQPNNLSLFASAGELSDYAPEVGGAWTEDIGDWDTAGGVLQATTLGVATFTGLADCLYDAKITTPAAGTTAGGLALRITDLTGASEDYWYVKVTPGTAGTDWELIEYVAGTPTQRAFGDADWAANTAYQIRAICYGTTIDCFYNGMGKITYGSASSGQTATKFGLRDEGNANMTFDNVVVFPRTSSVYEAEFGRV